MAPQRYSRGLGGQVPVPHFLGKCYTLKNGKQEKL